MKTLGIISEFNPFHNGHRYLLEEAKSELDVDLSVSLMSGDFVQRGEASIMDKYTRARVAVRCGFDLVIEMPNFVSLQAAEFFALKSVAILDKMNIDYLVFGIENISPDIFLANAKKILENQEIIDFKTKNLLSKGISYPKAHNLALSSFVSEGFLSSNNILALEYIKAIHKINSDMKACPIKRIKTRNKDTEISHNKYASSTAIRNNQNLNIQTLMPDESYNSLIDFNKKYSPFDYDYIYRIFRYKILIEDSSMENIIGYEEGLNNYLKKLASLNTSYESFINQSSSQRYTKSRIRRLILNYILDNTIGLNETDISFIKVLAFNEKATNLFKNYSKNLDIVINKKSQNNLDNDNLKIYKKNIAASNLYNLGINRELDYDYKHYNRPIKW